MATIFNPDNKEILTYGECLNPAMEIVEQTDADQYFSAYVAYIEKALAKEPRNDNKTAEEIARINIGYWAGYYGYDVQERVKRLYLAPHPIFDNKKLQ